MKLWLVPLLTAVAVLAFVGQIALLCVLVWRRSKGLRYEQGWRVWAASVFSPWRWRAIKGRMFKVYDPTWSLRPEKKMPGEDDAGEESWDDSNA